MAAAGLKSGATVGDRYHVERVLGQGALGSAYLCRDLMEGGALVVLRTLTAWAGSGGVAGLRQELSSLIRFKHPHLAQLLDFGAIDRGSTPYLVRQYVEGPDVLQGSCGWSVEQILCHLVKICRVLQYLHSRDVVHSHLKPSNVVLADSEGKELEPKLLDFGLDRFARRGRRDVANLAYTAPEVILGHARNPRSDLYSLGILAYQLLTHRLPFDDDDDGFLIQKQLQGRADMRPVERLDGGGGLAQVLLGLLEKDPEKRPSSAEDVIRLLSAASGRDYSGTLPGPVETYFSMGRFVGREKELAFLQERAARVSTQGRGWTVFLVGESGSGKSRCLEELRTWALLEGWRVVEASCLAREDRSYGPYRRILDRADLLHPGRPAAAEESPSFRFEDFAQLSDPAHVELSPGPAAGLFRDQVTREVVKLLADRTTLLLLHDFHWADEATVTVLDYLTSDILAHPILLCVSLSPGEGDQGHLGRLMDISVRQLRAEVLGLEPLSLPVIKELIASITGEALLGNEIGSWVHNSSGGNPFFVEEILKHLVDRDVLQRTMGKWHLAPGGFEKVEVPASVAVVLRQRLAHLSPGAAVITQWLALLRRAVSREQLQELSSLKSMELDERLRELVSRQILLEASAGFFEFRHALISEVIVSDLPGARRRRMHRRIGEVLEKHQGSEVNLQELAMHLTEGRHGAKAIHYALRAARESKSEFAHESALRFYDYLLHNRKFLSAEQQCEVSIEAADTCCALGNPKRAVEIIRSDVSERNALNGKLVLKVRKLAQLASSYQHLGDLHALRNSAIHGLRLVHKCSLAEGSALRASFLKQLAYCSLMRSHSKRSLSLLNQAQEALSACEKSFLNGQIFALISASQRIACDLHAAMEAAKKAIELLEPLQALHILPSAYSHLGISQASLGRFELAQKNHKKAVDTSRHTRSPILRSQALGNLAECLCRSGRLAEASEIANNACKLGAELANPVIYHSATATMAEIKLSAGDYNEANIILSKLSLEDNIDLPVYSKAHVYYLSAWMCYEMAKYKSALAHLKAMKKLESTEAPVYEHELGEILHAKIMHLQGNTELALHLLMSLSESLRKKRWPYQLCIVQLILAGILLDKKEFSWAAKYARNSLRLATNMSCLQYQAYAHLISACIRLNRWQLISKGLHNKISLLEMVSELHEALNLAEDSGAKEVILKVYGSLAEVAELLDDTDTALVYSNKVLDLLSQMASGLPSDCATGFSNHPERYQIRLKCVQRIESSIRGASESLPVGNIEEEHLRVIFRVCSAINSIRDLDLLMEAMGVLLSQAIKFKRAVILLKDDETGSLRLAYNKNMDVNSFELMDSISKAIVHKAFRNGRPFITIDARTDPRLTAMKMGEYCIGSIFCAPLISCGRTLGMLYVDQPVSLDNLSESTINLFASFCNLAAVAIDNALAHRHLVREKSELEQYLLQARGDFPELVGRSSVMQSLRERIALAAASPLDVLISGESGTGKELVARALQRTGRRAGGRFVPLDCGSLSDSLVESELFGYRKGAFTGALENRPGLMEAADGGVIFLDEISNLSVRLQRKLLRVLQEREVRRLGETAPRKINIQVIAATNKDLRAEVRNGKFRNDLYFRLNAMEIGVPPLREREGDIPLLLEWFLEKLGRNEGGRTKGFSQEARALLLNYPYPGNVRELKNIVEGSYYSTPGSIIEVGHLPVQVREGEGGLTSWEPAPAAWQVYKKIRDGSGRFDLVVKRPFLDRQIGSGQVRQIIHLALAETCGRYRDAFRLLGISERKYAIMIQFLKRNGCYLDFRPYRKSSR